MNNDALNSFFLYFSAVKSAQTREALAHYQCPSEAWRSLSQRDRSLTYGLKSKQTLIDRGLEWLQQPGNHLIAWHQEQYPQLLRQVDSPPAFIFVRGNIDLLWHPQLAIVGSRQPSASGAECAQHFAQCLSSKGFTITSGLARGIDTAAHYGALSHGQTIAALATGPDMVFPRCNQDLYEQIAESGALITEHAPGTPALRSHFPARNRIIAGLSQGTLVIEAAIRSGALITARLAAELSKEVMAIPGSIHNPMAYGCHQLIREGAFLVEQPDEVAHILSCCSGNNGFLPSFSAQKTPIISATDFNIEQLNGQQRQIWQALGHDSVGIDTICMRTALTAADISSILVGMELSGWVENHYGRYHRCSTGAPPARGQ
jgi:DNA processing protein